MTSSTTAVDGLAGRARSLDGLRGVAAVAVVLHHTFLTYPGLAAADGDRYASPELSWLVHSPLHLLCAGNEAVMVFFILSGIVLTLPVVRSSRFSWRAYYPSRLVRLYISVAASVLITLILIAAVPRAGLATRGDWLDFHAEPVSAVGISHDLTLVAGAGYLNSPLWSLQYEVLFSLLLPVYVAIAVRSGRLWWLVAVAAFAVSLLGSRIGVPVLTYLPFFLIGSLIATKQDVWSGLARRLNRARMGSLVWLFLLALALVELVFRWLSSNPGGAVALGVVELSASLLVLLAIYWAPMRSLLEHRSIQWLGAISFSLYLVHEPVLVTVAALLPGLPWAVPVIGIPLGVGLAWLFARIVEQPAHRLSQNIRRRVGTHAARESRSVPRV